MTKTSEIRTQFLEFFKSREHKLIPSAPLVPANDPTLMFNNAGMVPHKDIFTGRRLRPGPRAASVQKCIRISGKHNDLENVGRTSRHHTFFEMLGNFSFGDYFKVEACQFGWELLTKGFGLNPDKLWVTVFEGDDKAPFDEEAEIIWRDQVGVSPMRIVRCPAKDNFWSMGDTGPCGPCSEIHFDRGEAFGPAEIDNGERFFELWNLVFMQYQVNEPGGPMIPLPKPCIDTGAGLERIASVLQGVDSNYDIDIFTPLTQKAAQIAGKRLGDNTEDDVSIRVIADHARMTAFLIAEGIFPDKTGREYVLRRVMRRAIRHGHRLGINDLFLHEVANQVVEVMQDAYPELAQRRELISQICRQEEDRFRKTLGRGLELLEKNTTWLTDNNGNKMLPGKIAHDLTATYGFPSDLIEVIGKEEGFVIDLGGFEKAEKDHKEKSGGGKIGESAVSQVFNDLVNQFGATEFVGYDGLTSSSKVLALVINGVAVTQANEGQEVGIVLDSTPFYGESGGQVGDTGTFTATDCQVQINDTVRPVSDLFLHKAKIKSGTITVGDQVEAKVDEIRRGDICRHHTATHLVHYALRKVLGAHATQKGSRVDAGSLRFDFSHTEPLTADQIREIEGIVTQAIGDSFLVDTDEMTPDEAKAQGAMALFGENYGEKVRMVSIAQSKELCGGTHAESSSNVGAFFITGETGIAAGVRRIEAVAGMSAWRWSRKRIDTLSACAGGLKSTPEDLPQRIDALLGRERELVRELEQMKRKLASGSQDLMSKIREIESVKVLGARLDIGDPSTLRDTVDTLRQKIGSGVICLGGENAGKAALIVGVTKDLTKQLPAGKLIRDVANLVGGRGGGRPDMAQAGGPDVDKLDAAVEEIYAAVERIKKTLDA